ncbi:hypothetical protein ACFXKJ_19755 [Kitasatospora indigofera]
MFFLQKSHFAVNPAAQGVLDGSIATGAATEKVQDTEHCSRM